MFGAGDGDVDEPVVVGKYTQTRQRWLRAKIVKSDHGRSYKRRPLPCAKGEEQQQKKRKARITVTTI